MTDPDAPREQAPEREQRLPDDAEITRQTVATPEPDGARVAEAGHGYVGRTMDDDRKTTPRQRDGEAAVDEEGTHAGSDEKA